MATNLSLGNLTSNVSEGFQYRKGTSLYSIPSSTQVLITTMYSFSFMFGLLGNSVGLYIVIRNRRSSHCSSNLLIGNMALADLLVTLFAMPQAVGYLFIQNQWFGGLGGMLACKLAHFPYVVTISASVLAILVVSVERYCAAFCYLKNSCLRRPKVLTAIIWGASVVLASPYLFSFTVAQATNGQYFCVVQWGDIKQTYQSQRIYYLFFFICLYAVPLAFISVLYTLIARKLGKQKASRDSNDNIGTKSSLITAKRKVIRLLLALVIVFAVCSAPAHIMHYYMFYDLKTWYIIPIATKLFSFWVCHSNSAINPIIYILLSDTAFRREFLKVSRGVMCNTGSSSRSSVSTKTRRTGRMKGTSSTRHRFQGRKKETRS